jgi:putative FmdB family regulatory protein
MPTYEYQCDACEHNFDEFQSFSDKPLKKCPKCGKPKLRRVFGTGAAVIFKGSGFYQTDYRSESYKKGAKAEETAHSPKTETNGSAKTTDSNGTTGKIDKGTAKSAAKSSKSDS